MEPISLITEEDIPSDSIQTLRDKYSRYDYNWYKIALKSSNDLLSLLETAPISCDP